MADETKKTPPAMNWRFWIIMGVLLWWADIAKIFKKDLEPILGYWFSVAACGVAGAGVLLVVCLLLKWDWRVGLTLGLCVSLTYHTFEELRKALDQSFGALGTFAVSVVAASFVGIVAGLALSRLLKVKLGGNGGA